MSNRILLVPTFAEAQESHDVGLNMGEGVSEQNLGCYPQDFELPKAVQTKIGADVQQANAYAITSALFAGALVSLVQTFSYNEPRTPGWRALRFFAYTSISINLTGTTLALVLVKLCTDLEGIAQQMIIADPSSLPARVARGEKIPTKILMNHHRLLMEFGMTPGYKVLDHGAAIWITSGNVFTFTSVALWVWLAEDKAVAGATMIGTVPAILGLVYAFALTKR